MPNWHISYQLYHNILPKIKSVLIRKSQKFPEKLFGSSSHVSKSKKSFQQAVILVTGFKNLFKIYFFFLGSCLTILIEKIANKRKQSESANIICYWRTNPPLLWLRDQKVIRGTICTEVDDDNKCIFVRYIFHFSLRLKEVFINDTFTNSSCKSDKLFVNEPTSIR